MTMTDPTVRKLADARDVGGALDPYGTDCVTCAAEEGDPGSDARCPDCGRGLRDDSSAGDQLEALADATLVLLLDPEIRRVIDPNAYNQARLALIRAIPTLTVPPMTDAEREAWLDRREADAEALQQARRDRDREPDRWPSGAAGAPA